MDGNKLPQKVLLYGFPFKACIYKESYITRLTQICILNVMSYSQLHYTSACSAYGTTQLRSQTSSTWTTDDKRTTAGLSQQQLYTSDLIWKQNIINNDAYKCIHKTGSVLPSKL